MPISLSPTATIPAFPAVPRTVEWELFSVIGENRNLFSLQKQIYDWGGRILRASVSYQPMVDADARAMLGFMAACNGVLGTFLFGDPLATAPPGASGGSVSGGGQTGSTLVTSSSGMLPGYWIQIGVRLYMVTSVSGGTLGIFPTIRESPAGGSGIVIDKPKGLFRMRTNTNKWSVDSMKVYGVTWEAEEAL